MKINGNNTKARHNFLLHMNREKSQREKNQGIFQNYLWKRRMGSDVNDRSNLHIFVPPNALSLVVGPLLGRRVVVNAVLFIKPAYHSSEWSFKRLILDVQLLGYDIDALHGWKKKQTIFDLKLGARRVMGISWWTCEEQLKSGYVKTGNTPERGYED
jgi:hypothetical protein